MGDPLVFDQEHYECLNEARSAALSAIVSQVRDQLAFRTAGDVGCGIGYFSNFLRSMGFQVRGIDARAANVEEAQRRYPEIRFVTGDAEFLRSSEVGVFDLVICLGLLYHLENPFRVIRNLYSLTEKLLILESMCAPGVDPGMRLLDESRGDDQGLNYVAFYPTESCLVKMLYRAGFAHVYCPASPPKHSDFSVTKSRYKMRTMLVASRSRLDSAVLNRKLEPKGAWDIWPHRTESRHWFVNWLSVYFRKSQPDVDLEHQEQ